MRRSVAEHQVAVLKLIGIVGSRIRNREPERLSGESALGRVLASDVVAPIPLPPFDNSQMDGFAIYAPANQSESVDPSQSTVFGVAATIPAGVVPSSLMPGHAAPIMTGAMMPQGANAVVPVEDAVPSTFVQEGATVMLPPAKAGSFVRERGSDLAEGAIAIQAETLLNAAHMGLISAIGITEVEVLGKPRVLLLTTGDEVLVPGDPRAANGLPEGKIFDANMALLRANLHEAGVEVEVSPVIEDSPLALTSALKSRLSQQPPIDLIVSTGGISAGAFEVVKQALDGPTIDFLSVDMQPGGPQAIGTFDGVPFLGFPGNPVSGVISFELFLRPALSTVLKNPTPRTKIRARLEETLQSPQAKHQIRRGIIENNSEVQDPGTTVPGLPTVVPGMPTVREVGGPSSHLLASLAQANALIHLPVGVSEVPAGSEVEVWLL